MSRARAALGVFGAWLAVCAYTALIWWLSSQNIAFKVLERVPFKDKGVHFLEYGVLGALMANAVHMSWPHRRLRYLAALWLSIGLALVDELHQVYVPGRVGDVRDLIADALGALLATLAYAVAAWAVGRRRRWPSSARARRHEESAAR
jgi:VanZ family protein